MKEKNYILVLLVFHCLVQLLKSVAITCSSGYVALLYGTSGYCAKCDTTCSTCSNQGMNNCVVCPADFTFNPDTSYCIPPNTNQIKTLESSYKFSGFGAVAGWTNGYVYQDPTYGTTVYALSSGQTQIFKQFTLDPAHYQLRILVSLWIIDPASTASDYVQISVYLDGTGSPRTEIVPGGNVVSNIPVAASAAYQIYPSGWRGTNVDTTFANWEHDNAKVIFTSSNSQFGIREFIFIQYLCNKTACSRCTGATNTSCKQCTLSVERAITTAFPNQCLCNSANGYFKHPDYDYCVNPCPNRLDGQYYGDPDTKNCVLSCSNVLHYGDPAIGKCAATCSATISLGSVDRPLYYDKRNKKCVTICPSTEPYFNAADRTCYSTCPGGKFKNDQNMECVTDCPDTGVIPLYGSVDKCVEQCVGADNWGDPNTHRCTASCSLDASSNKYFQDNSTGRNLCVRVCPYPQRFGDDITNSSQPYCAEGCPIGYFGDYLEPRHCVAQCTQDVANSIKFYGVKDGDRQCVKVCPEATWGETTNHTCVQTAAQCKLDSDKYADNNTWLCVARGSCSKGRYTDDDSQSCVITCPDGKYADDATMHCQTGCTGTFFADPGINKCVETCHTQGLYSDVDSGNLCVEECNQAGSTPFRDPTTKKCVDICPTDKQLFADPIAKQCVYNCTTGTYAYDDSPTDTNKTCVTDCPGLYFADTTSGYGVCVLKCSQDPIQFGDVVGIARTCVDVCQSGKFGDQDPANGRLCVPTCPDGWFAQNDALRRCVKRCNSTTYGYNLVCVSPAQCPTNWVGDPSVNLCVETCPISEGTFSDFDSKLCVKQCPILGDVKYFADPTLRWCVQTCNSSHSLFGNNNTLTCETKCIDADSWADFQHVNRFCNSFCTDDGLILYYRNDFTKTCVLSTDCPDGYFGDNTTDFCVAKCPIINTNQQTWGHIDTQTCVEKCYDSLWGDTSTGIPLCIPLCPEVPAKWSYDTDMTCVSMCPQAENLYGQDFTRTCVTNCPNISDPNIPYQTFAFDGTRRCLKNCPQGTFGDYTTGKCYATPQQCTYGWGDDYNNSCVHLCTGPTPWDSFGDNATSLCTIFCTQGSYADSYTGTRQCVSTCPGDYDAFGNVTGSYDSFADDETNRCETYCMTPDYYADWQTHKCQTRCSGDDAADVPTYSNNVNKRCVIALACPETPDKLYGDNRTRTCTQKCFSDATTTEWADNLTRTCIPKCYHINDSAVYAYDTIFYGDKSTNVPMCVIKCPQTPRMFGNNVTNLCQQLCPDGTFGDPNNNRSCVADCYEWNDVIFYSQDGQRICVSYCKDGTFANWHNRHCETDPKDCVTDEYGNDGNNSCVALCPEQLNYFGDPSTKLCVSLCPNLTEVVNGQTVITLTYADYSNRLCVAKCNENVGLQGTFGDNFTNTCVQRCPTGSYGDALTVNRHCVSTCTNSNFADPLTMLCVSRCPASPPYYGHEGDWTCVRLCPDNQWADDISRKCVDTCPSSSYRLTTATKRQCVSKCPSNLDLYADDDSGNCESVCTLDKYADPKDRKCKASCLPLFQYSFRCVALCPNGYYANSTGDCVLPSQCDATVPYGENGTTKCVDTCIGGSYADPNSHYCIAVCPEGWYGDVNTCYQTCQTPGTSASTITQTCRSNCPQLTYHEDGICKAQCQTGYANDELGTCHTSCPLNPTRLFANTLNHDCVQKCPQDYVRDTLTGFCVLRNNGCSDGQFSDEITGNCVRKCSLGYWGNTHNLSCIQQCIDGQYGYESATERTCYLPLDVPLTGYYGNPQSKTFVTICPTTPKLYFADSVLNLCVQTCLDHLGTLYYGDPSTRQCEVSCDNVTFYTADQQKDKCVLKCTLGTFRFYNLGDPICVDQCPEGFADPSTRVCVDPCPINADTYGYYDVDTGDRVCLPVCPDGFYADPDTRLCNPSCIPPYYADDTTHRCVDYCTDSFADDNNRKCISQCLSLDYPSADNSTNKCVFKCPQSPDYYNQNHVCVLYCQQAGYFADPSTRQCVSRCPNVTGDVTYGDQTTGRCVYKCPELYWGDNSTNKCVKTCPPSSFADNQTQVCVADCPKNHNIYADPFLHVCAYTCSNGYFGSKVSQQCVEICDQGTLQSEKYWGDPQTTMCVNVCPSTIYSYGENVTRKCVTSCQPYAQLGFADNYSRICRDKCQNTLPVQTYADTTTAACVERCPEGYFAESTTNQCLQVCLTGFADNFTRQCVPQCPDDPQSYGDVNQFGHKICVYECLSGRFSNNDTNLCDIKCPTTPDFYGDPHTGRCVLFCTQGSYGELISRQCVEYCPDGTYADNLTRRCVELCPNDTEGTYRDTTTNKCVRVCPDLFWAENTSAICVSDCPKYSNGTQTYEDNISKFCVQQCPFPYFGKNDTHECVLQCSPSRSLYGHNQGRVCVTRLDCYPVGAKIYYADHISGTCVQVCPQTLWADDTYFICVEDCDTVNAVNKLQYRDMNNQKCVSLCSKDPDEYADDVSGNCVRKCPDGSYAYAQVGFRKCVASCQPYGLFADNSTNRCVSVCPTDPFMYADPNTHKCVYQCGDNQYFADNKTQTCVAQCPSDWQLWGDRLTYTCVQLCPDTYFGDDLSNRECNQQCKSPKFADKWTSKCVAHCSEIREFYYEDTSIGSGICVEQCPGDSYGYNPDQTCKYKNVDLSSSCPGTYYADRISKTCVELCPPQTFADDTNKYCESTCSGLYFADPVTRKCEIQCSPNLFALVVDSANHKCVQFCPSPYFAENSTFSCVQHCDTLYELQTTRTCETYCPEPYFKFDGAAFKDCRLGCTPLFADRSLRHCLPQCNAPQFGNPLTKTCDLFCPDGYYGSVVGRMCVQSCEQGTFADPSTRLCVTQCPQWPLLFADDNLNQCVQVCQNGFGYEQNRTCLSSCPNSTVNTNNVIYLADGSNHLCVLHCINSLLTFADYGNNICTQRCPDGLYANNFTKQCLPQCPTVPNDTFAENTSHICMDQCPLGSFGSSQNLHCVLECWWPNFADQTTRLCLEACPDGYFAQNQTARCNRKCDANTYADPTTKRCVLQCPDMHQLFKFDQDWTCVSNCPSGYYADDSTRKCMRLCDQPGMYSYQLTRQCVRECPIPYRGYDENHTCILSCPSLYFYNITRNKCTKCPIQCLVCTDPTSCLKCAPGYNLFNGICDISCQPLNGVITYSNPQGICVKICPYLWYGDNSSYACTQNCPVKQYGSNDTQLCQNCPQTCAVCKSLTQCSLCESSATLAIDKMCYKDCNSTHKFYYNNTCLNACPDGTYLTYTNVHCGACSANCATCQGNATNCLSCSGKYLFKNSCLVKCPQSYFGNPQFQCQLCSSSPNNTACTLPLNFSTQMKVQNYRYVIYIRFNQEVDIKKQIEDLIRVKLKVQRRLLDEQQQQEQQHEYQSTAGYDQLLQEQLYAHSRRLSVTDLINNGISYTYQILPNQIIKLYLIIDQTLVSPEFTVEILDPTAIISINGGGTLQNSQADFVIEKVDFYPPSASTKAMTNTAAKFTVIFILLIYALSFLWSDASIKSIQFLQLALFHATINSPIPPVLYYYLFQFKRSLFEFMPNFFSSFLSSNKSYHSASQKVIDLFVDFNFLRHLGQIFFFVIVFFALWAVLLFLSNKRLISNKTWHSMFDDVFKRRLKFRAVNDVLSLFYVPLIWFGLSQLKDLKGSSQQLTGYMNMNAALTIIFLLISFVTPLVWTFIWSKYQPTQFQQQLGFMCKRIKSNQQSVSLQIYQKDITQSKMGTDEKIKSQKFSQQMEQFNQPSKYFTFKNSKFQLQTMATYLYLLLMSIWLVGLEGQLIAQLSLLIATNCIYILYIIYVRPYSNPVNTILTPLIISSLVLIESYMVYFQLNDSVMYANQKTQLAQPLIITISVLYVIMILWTIWRVVIDSLDTWAYFKTTQFYLQYGDPNHAVQTQPSEDFEIFNKKAQFEQAYQVGDQIIQNITKTLNEHGQTVIRVTKKIFNKKKPLQSRKKKIDQSDKVNTKHNNNNNNKNKYQHISEDSSINYYRQDQENINVKKSHTGIDDDIISSVTQDDEQYVRVNEPTPFQLAKMIEQEQYLAKSKYNKKSQQFNREKNMNHLRHRNLREIDDDLRQHSDGEDEELQYEERQKKNTKQSSPQQKKQPKQRQPIIEIDNSEFSSVANEVEDLVQQQQQQDLKQSQQAKHKQYVQNVKLGTRQSHRLIINENNDNEGQSEISSLNINNSQNNNNRQEEAVFISNKIQHQINNRNHPQHVVVDENHNINIDEIKNAQFEFISNIGDNNDENDNDDRVVSLNSKQHQVNLEYADLRDSQYVSEGVDNNDMERKKDNNNNNNNWFGEGQSKGQKQEIHSLQQENQAKVINKSEGKILFSQLNNQPQTTTTNKPQKQQQQQKQPQTPSHKQQFQIFDLQQLIQLQQQTKTNKLMFLFEDQQQQQHEKP